MDRESDSFRYPFHIVREPNEWFAGRKFMIKRVFEKQTHIDLLKFANKFEAAYDILEKWYTKNSIASTEWTELAPVFIEESSFGKLSANFKLSFIHDILLMGSWIIKH